MAYKVIAKFADLKDGGRIYKPGDKYPRKGLKPTQKRIKELSGAQNRRGIPLIAEE